MEAEGTLGFRAGSRPFEKVRCTQAPFTWVLLGKDCWGDGAVRCWLRADAFGQHLRWSFSGKCLQQVVFGRVDSGIIPVMEGRRDLQEKVGWDVAAAEASAHPQGGRGPAELS